MKNIAAILLAAGESRRMNGHNKQLLPIEGVPLIRRSTEILLRAEPEELTVVLGHQYEDIEPLIIDLPAKTVCNERYRDGQMTSVQVGVQTLRGQAGGIMICLCDQPLMREYDYISIAEAFTQLIDKGSERILIPTYKGKRGNPVVLPRSMLSPINGSGETPMGDVNLGCHNVIKRNPNKITTLEMPNDHVVTDMDTLADYEHILQRIRLKGRSVKEARA